MLYHRPFNFTSTTHFLFNTCWTAINSVFCGKIAMDCFWWRIKLVTWKVQLRNWRINNKIIRKIRNIKSTRKLIQIHTQFIQQAKCRTRDWMKAKTSKWKELHKMHGTYIKTERKHLPKKYFETTNNNLFSSFVTGNTISLQTETNLGPTRSDNRKQPTVPTSWIQKHV
jgi:hypothetical protein